MFNRELSPEDKSVRGSLVLGLSESDVRLLDVFEGDVCFSITLLHITVIHTDDQEYTRDLVPVYPISPYSTLSPHTPGHQSIPAAVPHTHSPSTLPPPIFVHTYIWCQPVSQLTPSLWNFEDFVKNNAWKWVGVGSSGNTDYKEVDRRRGMGGFITRCGVRGESKI